MYKIYVDKTDLNVVINHDNTKAEQLTEEENYRQLMQKDIVELMDTNL